MEEMQDAFYACLAFEILVQQDNCYLYEVYDEFRDRNSSIQLSLIWSEALEQISKTSGVADSLRDRRNSIITEIQNDPSQWTEIYLLQLRSFIQQVDKLPRHSPNYPEINIVLGEEATLDRPATNGVLKRLWGYLAKLAQDAQANRINHTRTLQAQRPAINDGESLAEPSLGEIDADIVEASPKL
jgi:hypothetical protein